MTDGQRNARDALLADIERAVRLQVREELIMGGVVSEPWHWCPEDRWELARRLREIADNIDPPEAH